MREINHILSTGIQIEERYQEKKRQKEKVYTASTRLRFNDRKNTRSRKTQRIFCVDSSAWPIKTYWKHIKHPSK